MKRKTRNPQKSKQEIIEKSAELFNKHGYAGTKMEMIIKATGFQKGGIYTHFNSKTDLARAAFEYNYNQLKANYFNDVFNTENPKEQLRSFINQFKAYTMNPPIKGGCPILNFATEADDTDESSRLLVKKALNDWLSSLEKIMMAGITSGDFHADLDKTKEALFIIATLEGSIMIGQLKRSAKIIILMADNLMSYIEQKIFA